MNRRSFLHQLGMSAAGVAATPLVGYSQVSRRAAVLRNGEGRASAAEFAFARLRYESGDWDYNPKVCSNVLDAVVQYTDISVRQDEVVITLDSPTLASYPFLFMTGHKLVRFTEKERQGLVRYVDNGGLLFSDDCNHDVNGLYAKSFEAEMRRAFSNAASGGTSSAEVMPKLPKNHPIFRSFFTFDGPPQTSHELNGWGDNIVHGYVRGIERNGRLGVLYTNQDYGCEWDYSWKNKRFRTRDNTKFAVNLVVYAMT